MNNGYEQFFKKAQQNKNPKAAAPGGRAQSGKKQASPRRVQKRRKQKAPVGLIVALTILTAVSFFGYRNLDQVENLLNHVDIGFFGIAAAEDGSPSAKAGEKTTSAKAGEAEKGAGTGAAAGGAACVEGKSYTDEEISHFAKLNERKKALDLREQELNALEEELHKQKTEVEARIGKLEQIRTEISSVLKERVDVDEQRIATLVDFYSNMKPKQAAEIFNELNEDLAVEVLSRMKKKNAAGIMNLLNADKARMLSEKFTGYKRR